MESDILGQRIRQARERKGLSQVELAKALGIGQRGISELENGNRKLAVSELPILSEVLGVPVFYFLEDIMQPDDFDQLLLIHFHALHSDDLKKNVIEIVRILARSMS
jgi:transcriptional regulator with XRE-family HTH domain